MNLLPVFALVLGLDFPQAQPFEEPMLLYTELRGGAVLELPGELEFGMVGGAQIWVRPDTDLWIGLEPLHAEFPVRAELRWRGFALGWEHLCPHGFGGWHWPQRAKVGYNRLYFKLDYEGNRR